ncbi:MAG: hypothetical protein F2786_00680 [Actinobacteria bacterium]|uniref:Unannotated protein n=1 Tax=freshwater metagenome TaxID=449393 RepID=A0A6J7CEE6_9ZZZZ|nr:hypothetical protein [Actinomycetota bacterium]
MSSAATALIWWIVPAMGLIGGLGYVLWISKFQGKYQQGTQRSVSQFQRFQDSLRDSQARDASGINTNLPHNNSANTSDSGPEPTS